VHRVGARRVAAEFSYERFSRRLLDAIACTLGLPAGDLAAAGAH